MNEIHRVLNLASRRLMMLAWLRALVITSTAVLGLAILARIGQQVFGLEWTWNDVWQWVVWGGIAAALISASIWTFITRAQGLRLAQVVDERANLRETLSTALCVSKSEDPWAKSVVDSARETSTRVDVRQAIPYEAPRFWPVPIATALSLFVIWFALPRMDVMGLFAQKQETKRKQDEIVQVKAEVKQDEQKLNELLAKAGIDQGKGDKEDATAPDSKSTSTEEIRRAAMKKLTSLQERLEKEQQSEKNQALQAMKQALKQVKSPGPGPADKMIQSLAQGKFEQAKSELEQMQKQMNSGDLSAAQKEQAKEQLQKLSEQLDKMAKDRDEIAKKLEQAGMNPEDAKKAASNPEDLKKAIEAMKNLSPEQMKKLMEQAQSECKKCDGLGEMSKAMQKMAKGMGQQGEMNEDGQKGAESMGEQLSDMEMMDQEMKSLSAAMSECKSQMGKQGKGMCNNPGDNSEFSDQVGDWKAGEKKGKGSGSGGPGQGNGVSPESEEADTEVDQQRAQTKQGKGPIIASRLVQGDSIRGESMAEYSEAVTAAERAATEAIETQVVPPEYQNVVKTYFGRLAARTKAQQAIGTPNNTKPVSAPAPASPQDKR